MSVEASSKLSQHQWAYHGTSEESSPVVIGACARAARATLGRRGQVSPHTRFDLWVCTHRTISCYLTHIQQAPCNYQLMKYLRVTKQFVRPCVRCACDITLLRGTKPLWTRVIPAQIPRATYKITSRIATLICSGLLRKLDQTTRG